jgi:RP/EB family microtubule-associated protein
MSGDTIGMMEGAFFVSKGIILEWMNELLDVSFICFLLL